MLSNVYPEYNWIPWRFVSCPSNYWDDLKNQRNFMDWIGKELKINELNDWYKVTKKDIVNIAGKLGPLIRYQDSLYRILCAVYPEQQWLPWKFVNCPRNYWESVNNQRECLERVGKELNITDMKDWYNITVRVIIGYLKALKNKGFGRTRL